MRPDRVIRHKRFSWLFHSEPELEQRTIPCPRDNGVGGSSSINNMVYVRGHACDFDDGEENRANGWVRANAGTGYHPCSACKIGSDTDALAVVDGDCRVIGMDRVRVADSSVFPLTANGNLNAPTLMLGEKAADIIRGREPLPPSNAPVWIDADWQTRQRAGQATR